MTGYAHKRRLNRTGWRRLGLLPRDSRGHALVEVALILPLLLGLFFGVSEICEGFTVSRRLETAAHTAADLVARTQSVRSADLDALKPMIDEILKPFPVTSVSVVWTSVVADADNTPRVAWSYGTGSGASAHAVGSTFALPPGLTLPNTSVIVTELRYTFRSTLSSLITGDLPMRAEGYQRPRFALQVAKLD